MKTGLLGGAFNPIHCGHIYIAKQVMSHLALDRVLLLPTEKHPFKADEELCSFYQRLSWVEKAVQNEKGLFASDLDKATESRSYTINLLQRLHRLYPTDSFYFIIGMDNVSSLCHWRNIETLIKLTTFAVLTRPGVSTTEWKKVPFIDNLQFVEVPPMDISSTQIRELILEGKEIVGLVPESIREDIICAFSGKIKA